MCYRNTSYPIADDECISLDTGKNKMSSALSSLTQWDKKLQKIAHSKT